MRPTPAMTERVAEHRIAAMQASPRCGARTRAGTPCRSPAVSGRSRCRMHGGATGSGAPKGNRNALKHGFYSKAAKSERRAVQALIRAAEGVLREV